MKKCGIYKITSPCGKVYIGQSIDIKRRIKKHKYCPSKDIPLLYETIQKYGFENHSAEIIIECEKSQLNEFEKFYINKFNSFNSEIGLNSTSGGINNWKVSEATKIKMLNRPKQICSGATRLKLSNSLIGKNKGRPSPRKGAILSEETKLKISQNSKHTKSFLGRKHSEETKANLSEKRKGIPAKNRRPIINIETQIVYSHKQKAADSCGMKVRTLKAKLEGKLKNNTPFRYYN